MFLVDWCFDCCFVEFFLFELEVNFFEFIYYYVDCDKFIDMCVEWEIYGILSFVVFNEGKEVNCFVSKDCKIKEEIEQFLIDFFVKV